MSDETDPLKNTIARLLSEQNASHRQANEPESAVDRELQKVIDWKEQMRADLRPAEPKIYDLGVNHTVVSQGRMNRRLKAAAQAEQRTVAALEAILQDAKDSRAANVWMLGSRALPP